MTMMTMIPLPDDMGENIFRVLFAGQLGRCRRGASKTTSTRSNYQLLWNGLYYLYDISKKYGKIEAFVAV